jgi:hypothetical protein
VSQRLGGGLLSGLTRPLLGYSGALPRDLTDTAQRQPPMAEHATSGRADPHRGVTLLVPGEVRRRQSGDEPVPLPNLGSGEHVSRDIVCRVGVVGALQSDQELVATIREWLDNAIPGHSGLRDQGRAKETMNAGQQV